MSHRQSRERLPPATDPYPLPHPLPLTPSRLGHAWPHAAKVAWDIVEEQAAAPGDKEEFKPTLDVECASPEEYKRFTVQVTLPPNSP